MTGLLPDLKNGDIVDILSHQTGLSGQRENYVRKIVGNTQSINIKTVISGLFVIIN